MERLSAAECAEIGAMIQEMFPVPAVLPIEELLELSDAEIRALPASDRRRIFDLMCEENMWAEQRWKTFAPRVHAYGWGIIPQQRKGQRLPGKYAGDVIKWKQYQDTRPADETMSLWTAPSREAQDLIECNVALLLGSVSGFVWALDIDVTDPDLVAAIEAIADRILGPSPFRRVGNAPKTARLYRAANGDEMPKNRSRLLSELTGDVSGHGIEIQGQGKLLTIFGQHHSSGRPFDWLRYSNPAMRRPRDVPLVTAAQVEEFFAAVHAEVRPFHQAPGGRGGYDIEYADDGGNVRRPTRMQGDEWKENADGLVVDGREKLLFHLARWITRANPGKCGTSEGRAELSFAARESFCAMAVIDGKWRGRLDYIVADKVSRAADRIVSGEAKPLSSNPMRTTVQRRELRPDLPAATTDGCKGELAWLLPKAQRSAIRGVVFPENSFEPAAVAEREIPATAAEWSQRVTAQTTRQIEAFFANVENAEGHARTHIVSGPTGAGKTTNLLQVVMDFHRRRREDWVLSGKRIEDLPPFPILMPVPMHRNAEENVGRAQKLGLRAMAWKGKKACAEAGGPDACPFGAQIAALQEAGRSTGGLCKATVQNPNGEEEEVFCQHFSTCTYQQQARDLPSMDIVFCAHSYLTVSAPAAFRDIRVVVIDESFHGKIIKSTRFPAETLQRPRNGVAFLTAADKAAGRDHDAYDTARTTIAEAMLEMHRRGGDPVGYFLRDSGDGAFRISLERKRELLDMTIALCSRVLDDGSVVPLDSDSPATRAGWEMDIDKLCSVAERRWIHEEERYWRLVREAVDAALPKDVTERLEDGLGRKPAAQRKRDRRIHWERGATAKDPGTLRISWLSEHNFQDAHILVLDASADTQLVATTLGRKVEEIVTAPIPAVMRLRTAYIVGRSFAKTGLLPRVGDNEPLEAFKARLAVQLQRFITHVAAMHPVGGIVVCAPLAVRELICTDWSCPERILWLHYGATKGLNVAEGCDAAIAIGCISPSLTQIDDIVAAIAGDADEAMIDPIGPHRNADEPAPAQVNADDVIRLRNGRSMVVTQRSVEGNYAKLALRQIRQEEALQFLGRLRPIHRDRITTFYNVGSYIPPSVIVDEVIEWDDVVAQIGSAVEVAREHRGPIGAGRMSDEIGEGERFHKRVAEDGFLRERMFSIHLDGELRYVPAHSPSVIDDLKRAGGRLMTAPKLEPIPAVVDRFQCTPEQEEQAREDALLEAYADGWTPDADSRMWSKTVSYTDRRGEERTTTLTEDRVVVARIYRTRIVAKTIASVVEPAETIAGVEDAFEDA